jgi:hypothetical protein
MKDPFTIIDIVIGIMLLLRDAVVVTDSRCYSIMNTIAVYTIPQIKPDGLVGVLMVLENDSCI